MAQSLRPFLGRGQVEAVSTEDVASGKTSRVDLSGVFVFVGLDPNTQYLRELLPLDNAGHIPTDVWMQTEMPGLPGGGGHQTELRGPARRRRRRRRHRGHSRPTLYRLHRLAGVTRWLFGSAADVPLDGGGVRSGSSSASTLWSRSAP